MQRSLTRFFPSVIQSRTSAIQTIRSMSTRIQESEASPAMISQYREWKAMGVGGTSHTWAGFLSCKSTEKTMAFGADETLDLTFYKNPSKYVAGWSKATVAQKAAAQKPFLSEPLPQRQGQRARAKPFVYPQRERNASSPQPEEVKQAYLAAFSQLGKTNIASTEWGISKLEKHGDALFTKPSIPLTPLAGPTQREICHIHGTDLSAHVTLSFADAEEVIAKGWGERHRLSGTDWIHLGYTMLYVPNSVEEVEILAEIMQASVEYMRSG